MFPFRMNSQEGIADDTKYQANQNEEKKRIASYFRISGDAGAYGELYKIAGKDRRRPPSTGRIYIRPTLTLLESFSISFDLMMSTEGSSARQQINQFALHPTWGWGKAHIGDFSHDFSRYTLGGVSIRGGGIEINPGKFRFQLVGGQTQRAIKADPYSSTYSRYLAGLKIGVGHTETSHFDINIVRAKDNVRSLPRDHFMDIRQSPSDTTKMDTSYIGVTPQENLVIGINTKLKLFDGLVNLKAEAAGSAFTRDLYSDTINLSDAPDIVNKIYKARVSSNLDYAYTGDLSVNYKIFNAHIAHSLIGPGYASLGLPSLINDKKVYDASVALRLLNNNVVIQGMYQNQRDNLVSQKQFTTSMNTYGVITNIRPTKDITLMLNVMNNNIKNNAIKDTMKVNNINTNYSANLTYQFSIFNLRNVLSTGYSTQFSKDLNILRKGNDVHSQNINFNLTTTINPVWSVSSSWSYNSVDIQSREATNTMNLGLRLMNRMLGGRLSSSVGLGFADSKITRVSNFTIQSGYSILAAHSINFNMRAAFYSYKKSIAKSFNEYTASLGYAYRF